MVQFAAADGTPRGEQVAIAAANYVSSATVNWTLWPFNSRSRHYDLAAETNNLGVLGRRL